MQFTSSTPADLETIFQLYDAAIELQKKVSPQQWKGFERSLIETEITENRQWKILIDGQVACIFAVTFSDPVIWGEKNQDKAMYIHRIVTNPAFRGRNFVLHIVAWAKKFAREHNLDFVRLDTWADNQKLHDVYVSSGFSYVGQVAVNSAELPKHYSDIKLALFELAV